MPREQGDAGVSILEKKNCSTPAITRSGRRFLNLFSFFQSKLSPSSSNHQQITATQGVSQHCVKETSAKLSRWLRAMGKFVGSKDGVREELSFREKYLDQKKATDGYSVTNLQGEKLYHLALKKKAGEEQDRSIRDQRKRGRGVVTPFELPQEPRKEAPRKGGNINKRVLSEGVPCIARRDEQRDAKSHYELVKPVLEPMPVFSTSDLEQGKELGYLHSPVAPELQNSRHSSEGDHFKSLWFDSDDDLAQQVRVTQECKNVVTQLSCKKGKQQGLVATEARVTMATLGDISSLVAMLDSNSSTFCPHCVLVALLNLATDNDLNKAAIVDAGAVSRIATLLNPHSEPSTQVALLACFTTLSTLDRNNALIATSGAIPPLTNILKNGGDVQIQSNALELLYNLSLTQCNVETLVDTGATSVILDLVKNPRHCEQALAILANVVTVPLGRKATMSMKDGVETLVGILAWGANSTCQERAVGLLMVMTHHSYGYRQAIVRKRAIPALLELSLLGSAVAQKRAVRVLGFLRDDREQGRAVWASVGYFPRKAKQQQFMIHAESSQNMFGDGREALNLMVKQRLEHNLQQVVRRDFVKGERMRSLSLYNTGCSCSTSLPL